MRRSDGSKGRALWATLALWMLPALAFLMVAGLLLTAKGVHDVADSAYDRSLAGAIRAIELNVSIGSGGVGVELPYPLFEGFAATADGEVFFRVSTDDRLVQIGEALLPPAPNLAPDELRFYNAEYLGRSVRIGALKRVLEKPLYGASTPQSLIIEVAETTGSREAFRLAVLSRSMWRDAAAVVTAALLLALGVHMALRPLRRLEERLDRRASDDLRQVDASGLPREVQPLVSSVNRLVDRHRIQGEAQRRFIEDASHQLKTPLAVLRSQIDYAAALDDPARMREVLHAMRDITDRSARLSSQLLAMARARNAALWAGETSEPVDVAALLADVARLHLPAARKRRIALEVEAAEGLAPLRLPEALLFEALSNLVDNAITASPPRGEILLTAALADDGMHIEIRDNGPGIAPELMERLGPGQRFGTLSGQRPAIAGNSGLGIAIVHEIMRALGGRLFLLAAPEGGVIARLVLGNGRVHGRQA